ncbi:transcriptional regulator ATRX homolog [Patella vulgata]|uniref:transcriptional regulator ATRX homolog n=1 Tax=Patella vulgata TaxID=6465 RepID=UPI0024A980ED|nr:transcriptional regulator ATRX homolog [Patella vulgata]
MLKIERKESIDKHTQTDDEKITGMNESKETIETIPTASAKELKSKEKLQKKKKSKREIKNSPDEDSISIPDGIARPRSWGELPMTEEVNVQKTPTTSIPTINSRGKLQIEESIDDEASPEKRQSLTPTLEIKESIEDENDSQYYTTRHKSISIDDGSRRKSLFEESADDEKMIEQREAKMEDAIEEKVKEVRRGSIFDDSYLDTDPAVSEVPVSKSKDTHRPSLLQSGDGSRRKSLFEESADDEKMIEQREAKLEDAIEEKVKEVRRGSIFDDSYLDTDPAVPEVPVSKPKDTRGPSLLQSLFNRAKKQKPKVSHEKRQSLIGKSELSVCSCLSEVYSEDIQKKERNVSFGGVDHKSFTLLGKSNNENTNSSGSNKTAHTCEHCGGSCIYYTDPFHEILNCQVLAITYMNSNSSRIPLRRLIQDKINQTIKH